MIDEITEVKSALAARLDEYDRNGATVFEWLELAGELRDFGMTQPAQVCERKAADATQSV